MYACRFIRTCHCIRTYYVVGTIEQSIKAISSRFNGPYTVKPVCKDHPRDQENVVSEDRWSLYRGTLL